MKRPWKSFSDCVPGAWGGGLGWEEGGTEGLAKKASGSGAERGRVRLTGVIREL